MKNAAPAIVMSLRNIDEEVAFPFMKPLRWIRRAKLKIITPKSRVASFAFFPVKIATAARIKAKPVKYTQASRIGK